MLQESRPGRHLRPLRRGAAGIALVVLAATGFVAAMLLFGSPPASGAPAHGSMGTSTDSSPPPPPPPSAPDPLQPSSTAPAAAVPPEQKAGALEDVHKWVPGVAAFCALAGELSEEDDMSPHELLGDCTQLMALVVAAWQVYKDPPDPNFAQIGLPSPPAPQSFPIGCLKRLSRHDCAGLKAAFQAWSATLSATLPIAGATTVAANRFSGAVQAGSVSGTVLQAAAVKALCGELVAALAAEQKAGGSLGFLVRRLKMDIHPTAKTYAAALKKLIAAPPKAAVATVLADGLAHNSAEVQQILAGATQGTPVLPLSSAIGAGFPTAAFNALYHSLTAKEYAALVRGLVAQNAVGSAVGTELLDDLRGAALASSATERTPFLTKLGTAVSSKVSGPAGTLLTAAISGLVFQ
jgi:hypothetical protein